MGQAGAPGHDVEHTDADFHRLKAFRCFVEDAAEKWLVVGDAMNAIGPAVVEAVGHVQFAHETISA